MLSKLQKIIICALSGVLALVVVAAVIWNVGFKKNRTTEATEETAVTAEAETAEQPTEQAEETETVAVEEIGEVQTELDTDTETVEANEVSVAATEMAMEEQPDIDEFAYLETLDEEQVVAFKEFLEEQPDIEEIDVQNFFMVYGDLFSDYPIDPDGNRCPPLSNESLLQTDDIRNKKAIVMGLNKLPIDDATAFPFDLTDEEVKLVLAAKLGSTVAFEETRIDDLRVELFREWFENPILFEAYVKLWTDQKIGEDETVSANYAAGREFIEKCEASRSKVYTGEGEDPYADIRGKGLNIWLRKINGNYYNSVEYQKYVISMIYVFYPRNTNVMVLTAKAGDHYHLIPGDFNTARVCTLANYSESLTSLVFTFYLKNGKIAIRYGANLRDKRPEVLNYTVTKKPAPKKVVPPVTITEQIDQTLIWYSLANNSSNGGGGNPGGGGGGGSNPPGNNVEYKSPASGSASQGNAQVGGGTNDDSGSGEWKPDQGNSKSSTVEGSQYQQGTSNNTDGGNNANYDTGQKADNTDNGNAPDTSKSIVSEESKSNDNYKSDSSSSDGGGEKKSAGDNNGKMSSPPPTD